MCGIFGIIGKFSSFQIKEILKKMAAESVHRGPDDEGIWAEDGFGFGMRRLSIIDLTGGHQPMWDRHMDRGIVYNGELYNYRQLRQDIQAQGGPFHTQSDTEVILKSLLHKGKDAFQDWNGMYALAHWSRTEEKLLLVRDRLGIKPMYYFWDGFNFLFASEIKSLIASKCFKPIVNRQAIWDYLSFRYVPSPHTIWKNIKKLPPAHILEWSPGKDPKLTCYWETDVRSPDEEYSLDQKKKEFEDLFLDSVQKRLSATDVPVGVLLSGGLDSSAIAAAAVELGHKNFHTFSVGFSGKDVFSELPFARLSARHVGAKYHEVILNQKSFMEMLPEAIYASDEPLADMTSVPMLALSRLARQWVKVVLSGEGSDEILAGYDFDQSYEKWKRIQKIQSWPPFVFKAAVAPLSVFSSRVKAWSDRILNTPLSKWNASLRIHMTRHWLQDEKRNLWANFEGQSSDRIIDLMYQNASSQEPLDQLMSVYQKSWLVEDLLMKADKMSMAASLELRVPFLDHRLVEWANRQPAYVKVGGNKQGKYTTKNILRQFAEKRLPKEIIDRPKKGFPVPVYQWLNDEKFLKWVNSQLVSSESRSRHIFSPYVIQECIERAKRGDHEASQKIWLLIVLESWFRAYHVSFESSN